MVSTEDKNWWTTEYAKLEHRFVQMFPELDACINPLKSISPYAPDLIVDDRIADLKCQQTPFFRAYEKYRIFTQFAVTFNRKDARRYAKLYPNIVIYFWVNWLQCEATIGNKVYRVEPMSGVWRIPFWKLRGILEDAPLHVYRNRVDDEKGNAKESFVFDVRKCECLMLRMKGVSCSRKKS